MEWALSNSNPYPNRPYPVGTLSYELSPERAAEIADLKHVAMLEFGEQEILFDMPRILGIEGLYINLGHALGGSALLLARGLIDQSMDGYVVSVDTFNYFKHQWARANQELSDRKLDYIVELYQGTTLEFANEYPALKAAFVFIDADHSYEGVLGDFLAFSPMVVPGGAVAFHDTNQEPSHQVIQEQLVGNPAWQLIEHVNRIKVFQRV